MSHFGAAGTVFNGLFVLDSYLGRRRVDRVFGALRRKNQTKLLHNAAKRRPPGQPPSALPARDGLTAAEFQRDFARPGRPVVVRGYGTELPALRKWTPDFFAERYGHIQVNAVDGTTRTIDDLEEGTGHVSTRHMSWSEQIERMKEGHSDYLAFFGDVFSHDPSLLDDLEIDQLRPYLGRRLFGQPMPKLFLGASTTSTQWHCAELQNLFVEISGRKRWLLAAPADTPCFDPRISTSSQQYCHSMIDFRDPDTDRYPLYAYMQTWEVILEPGDLLYIPPFWWHCVENLTDTMGVALWWPNLGPALRSHPTLAWLTVLSPQHVIRMTVEHIRGRRPGATASSSTILDQHSG